MAQVSETRTSSTPQNIQDAFLNHARRERLSVNVHFMDGRQFEWRIKNFDRFAVIIDFDGTDQMIFKHAIASITMPRSVPHYHSE